MSTDTRHALAALLPCPFCGNSKGLAVANENPQDLSGGYFIACPSCDASTGLRFACGEDPIPLLIEQWNRRAALSAQPVAGAVAQQDQQADALRFRWLCEHPDWHFIERLCREFVADSRMEFLAELRRVIDARRSVELGPFEEHVAPQPQAAPAPQPSAQAVAHPSHQTVREWMPVSEALRLSDLWTAGDLDNCGQWRAAIKVLADEVRALAASPQPEPTDEAECEHATIRYMLDAAQTEPSAQGEPVAWNVMQKLRDEVMDFRHTRDGMVRGGDYVRLADLLTAAERIDAEAEPSTPPPAVVEAVPLTDEQVWRDDGIMSANAGAQLLTPCLMELVRAIERAHGIAPKAAQEKP